MKNNTPTNNTASWTQTTPVGELIISAGPAGVRSVLLRGGAKHDRDMNGVVPTAKAPAAYRSVASAFERYFKGDVRALDGLQVDLGAVRSPFQRKVLTTLRKLVGPGATISYGELASAAGRPGAARAVGSAMAHNPVPIILPCHRVLASDGTLGGYGGGLEMKRNLLALEGASHRGKKR